MPSSNGHNYDHCRGLGHRFEPYDVHVTRSDIHVSLQCPNCTTIRHFTLTRDGYIIPGKSRYEYPEQQDADAEPYCRRGQGRVTVDDRAGWRVAAINYYKDKEKKR
jgi:hypothetical protein